MPNYTFNLMLYNDLKEEVTFKFFSGQEGTAKPPSLKLAHNTCGKMKVTKAQDSIKLKVKPKTKKAIMPNKIIFMKPEGFNPSCPPKYPDECGIGFAPSKDKKHWIVTIKHSYSKAKIFSDEMLEKEMVLTINSQDATAVYTDGVSIFIDPPPAQTPVTATDKQ